MSIVSEIVHFLSCLIFNLLKGCKLIDYVYMRTYMVQRLLSPASHVCYLYRTLTTPVELIKCLRSIKEHAFVASDYPVVITLEDHLTADLQAKVAEVGFCNLMKFYIFWCPACLILLLMSRWSLKHLEMYCFHPVQSV